MKTCKLDGCDKPTRNRHLVCEMHRGRMKRRGSYDPPPPRNQPSWATEALRARHAAARAELIDEIEGQLQAGASLVLLPARLGYENRSALVRRLHRAKRHDLAVLFDRVAA